MGGEFSLLLINEINKLTPFLGLGISAGFSNTLTSESLAAGNQSYTNDSFSMTAFVPLGIEVKIANKYRIGIMEEIAFGWVQNDKSLIDINDNTSSESMTGFSIDAGNPVFYFSIWF